MQNDKPKFKNGAILRYSNGPTALFQVIDNSICLTGHRYYGIHCLGGKMGAYEDDCAFASHADLLTWEANHKESKKKSDTIIPFKDIQKAARAMQIYQYGLNSDKSDCYHFENLERGEQQALEEMAVCALRAIFKGIICRNKNNKPYSEILSDL